MIAEQVAGPGPQPGGPVTRVAEPAPEPMQWSSWSRRAVSRAIRSSSSGRHDADSSRHSGPVGPESGGSRPRAPPISSRVSPTRCAAWMKASRRRTSRRNRRCPPAVRVETISPLSS